MNLLKSLFISLYMMLIMVVAFYAGWMLYQGGDTLVWLGAFLTTAPILIFFGRLMMFRNQARTSAKLPLVNFIAFVGMAMTAWAILFHGGDILAFELAIAGWCSLLLYVFWYSVFSEREQNSKLIFGNKIPNFFVIDSNKKIITSAQLTDKPAILIFYRGNWCPLCSAQIKELVARYKDISKYGVRVALISPQPHTNSVSLSKAYDVNFDFLTDKGNAAARALGIESQNGIPMGMQMLGYDSETVLPTVIITDKEGEIIWTHETDNYRIRPEPDVFLNVLRKHGVVPALPG